MCEYCEKEQNLLRDRQLDTEYMLFSSIDIYIKNSTLMARTETGFECEETQENPNELEKEYIKTAMEKSISINYCPICGRQLKETR